MSSLYDNVSYNQAMGKLGKRKHTLSATPLPLEEKRDRGTNPPRKKRSTCPQYISSSYLTIPTTSTPKIPLLPCDRPQFKPIVLKGSLPLDQVKQERQHMSEVVARFKQQYPNGYPFLNEKGYRKGDMFEWPRKFTCMDDVAMYARRPPPVKPSGHVNKEEIECTPELLDGMRKECLALPLATLHPQPGDEDILFEEQRHLYCIRVDGKWVGPGNLTSTTALIHEHFPEFDQATIIPKMIEKHRRLRQENTWSHAPAKTKRYLLSFGINHWLPTIKQRLQQTLGSEWFQVNQQLSRSLTATEIANAWKENADRSSRLGTYMHDDCELFVNRLALAHHMYQECLVEMKQGMKTWNPIIRERVIKATFPTWTWEFKNMNLVPVRQHPLHQMILERPLLNQSIEFRHFLRFWKEFVVPHQLIPFRTEWRIFDVAAGLTGSIDVVFKKKGWGEQGVMVGDWKRSKEVKLPRSRVNSFTEFGKAPLSHMQECNWSHYNIQLQLYARKIKDLGFDVRDTRNIVFHPSNPSYVMYVMPDEQHSIQALLDKERKSIRAARLYQT
jgi:hypothetical protein